MLMGVLTSHDWAAGLSYSQLSLILRYLAFVHRMLKEVNPEAPELNANDRDTDHIIAHLLGSEREPPPLPTDGPQVWCLSGPTHQKAFSDPHLFVLLFWDSMSA